MSSLLTKGKLVYNYWYSQEGFLWKTLHIPLYREPLGVFTVWDVQNWNAVWKED